MSFLHLSLLAGAAAIAVPIMLHLFGQKQPKLINFPAMRFVVKTAREQSSSWQLRHFLLLLLRVLILGALAFALARPRVHSAMLGSAIGVGLLGVVATLATLVAAVAFFTSRPLRVWLTATVVALSLWIACGLWGAASFTSGPMVPGGDQSAPIAAAIIVDNGPTLEYRAAGQTRIQQSQEFVKWLLGELPADSRIGILSGAPVGALSLDPAAATSQVNLIRTQGSTVDLASRLGAALELVSKSKLERKEIYIVTDLMQASWQSASPNIAQQLSELRDEVLVQIVDIGDQDAANWSLSDVTTDTMAAPVGSDVTFNVTVNRPESADQKTATVELYAQELDPTYPVVREGQLVTNAETVVDRQVIDFGDGTTASAELVATNLQEGTNNFRIQIDKPDPLEIDNERFVSIPTFANQPTLVVASDRRLTQLLAALVDPFSPKEEQLIDEVQYVQMPDTLLEKYAVVCLYDPPRLPSSVIDKLYRHAAGGGGLLVVLGPQAATGPIAENSTALGMDRLLPGKLVGIQQRGDSHAFFDVTLKSHPVFSQFGGWTSDGASLWNQFPIYKNWELNDLVPTARVLLQMSDSGDAALVTHDIGRGQVLTLTTLLPEPENQKRDLWNLLWVADSPYPAFALLVGAFDTLSGVQHTRSTFLAGQTVSLSNDLRQWPANYTLYAKHFDAPIRLTPPEGFVDLPALSQAGVYYLRGQRDGPIVRSISANISEQATRLTRADTETLDSVFGEDNYRLAHNKDEVTSSIGQARFGRELFPMLLTLVAGLFLAEQAMSNRFYSLSFSPSRGKRK